MPVRPENRGRYPPSKQWQAIRHRILARAGNLCEGTPQFPNCRAENGKPHPLTRAKVVLTIAHMDHRLDDHSDENLKALCQRCHNAWDAKDRAAGIKARKRAGNAIGDLIGWRDFKPEPGR